MLQWFQDIAWAIDMFRVRRLRRRLLFSRREIFDNEVRPKLDGGTVIAHPDAIYLAGRADIQRARNAATASRPLRELETTSNGWDDLV